MSTSAFAVLGIALGAAIIPVASLVAPVAESVQQVGELRTARSVHTATTLRTGQVLFVGGMANGGSSLHGVELFDPGRNDVERLPDLLEARSSHTSTLLPDGRVAVAGGYAGEYLSSVEIFDPTTRRFRAGGKLTEARSGHTATLLPDGKILMIGGVGRGWTFLASAELFDPATGRSTAVGPMSVPRESHTATVLGDGRVVVIGGHAGRREKMAVYTNVESFSPATLRFARSGDLETPRHKHDAIALPDGRILIVGGADRTDRVHFETTELYDPQTKAVREGPDMTDKRYKIAGTSILLPDGQVLITSGARTVELFDPATGRMRRIEGRYPDAYRFATASLLPNGSVIIAGGYAGAVRNTAGIWRFRR